MNSSILNSKKKRRSSGKFLISNKQAKLLINRKCRRVNLLDKNRHIDENEISISEEASTLDTNTVKQEPVLAESIQQMEHDQTPVHQQEQQPQPQQKTTETTDTTTKSISKLSELKNKFTNLKNTLVKSISNIKKPPSANNNNLVVVKEEKTMPTIKSSASFHRTQSTSSTLARQASRKELPKPNENLKPNEPNKRLSALTRSSSVSTIKTSAQVKTMKKYESTASFKSVNLQCMQQHDQKENHRPAFNQYAKITYNDRVLYQAVSPMQKKVELRRILAHKNMSSSHNKLDALK